MASGKQYILDYYGHPKSLHRLEVHLNSEQIAFYATKERIVPSLDWLFDRERLEAMYFHYLHSVIRFTRKRDRKPLD